MNFQQVLTVASVVISALSYSEAASCLPQFKNVKAMENTANFCSKRLEQTYGIKVADLPKATKENHWNDKCYSNCTLKGLNLMVNRTILKDSMIAMVQANAPTKDAATKIIAIVNECAEALTKKREHMSTVKPKGDKISPKFDLSKTKNMNAKDKMPKMDHFACSKAALFMACYTEKEAKVC